ncbi:hypothetical protein PMAYCL1PPCAC_27771, partial [Pristionchus mayeri]
KYGRHSLLSFSGGYARLPGRQPRQTERRAECNEPEGFRAHARCAKRAQKWRDVRRLLEGDSRGADRGAYRDSEDEEPLGGTDDRCPDQERPGSGRETADRASKIIQFQEI